jgi:hypothetical protein
LHRNPFDLDGLLSYTTPDGGDRAREEGKKVQDLPAVDEATGSIPVTSPKEKRRVENVCITPYGAISLSPC